MFLSNILRVSSKIVYTHSETIYLSSRFSKIFTISILMNIHILGSRSKSAFLRPNIYGCKNIIGNTCILSSSSFFPINIYSNNYNIYIHIDKKLMKLVGTQFVYK